MKNIDINTTFAELQERLDANPEDSEANSEDPEALSPRARR